MKIIFTRVILVIYFLIQSVCFVDTGRLKTWKKEVHAKKLNDDSKYYPAARAKLRDIDSQNLCAKDDSKMSRSHFRWWYLYYDKLPGLKDCQLAMELMNFLPGKERVIDEIATKAECRTPKNNPQGPKKCHLYTRPWYRRFTGDNLDDPWTPLHIHNLEKS
nr:PREDICTED: uncharacterized protein LOC109032230 [Bemisia tabaci]